MRSRLRSRRHRPTRATPRIRGRRGDTAIDEFDALLSVIARLLSDPGPPVTIAWPVPAVLTGVPDSVNARTASIVSAAAAFSTVTEPPVIVVSPPKEIAVVGGAPWTSTATSLRVRSVAPDESAELASLGGLKIRTWLIDSDAAAPLVAVLIVGLPLTPVITVFVAGLVPLPAPVIVSPLSADPSARSSV